MKRFHQLKTGRPRPVYIEVPHEVLAAEEEVKLLEPELYDPPAGDTEHIAEAAHLLAAAQRPAIWAGTGVQRSGASQVLQALAEHLQAPVVTGSEGKGAISDHHPLSLGMAELRFDPPPKMARTTGCHPRRGNNSACQWGCQQAAGHSH